MVHGECVVECADKAVEDLMHLEDRYMCVSVWHSKKACKEYQNAIAFPIWTKKVHFMKICTTFLLHTGNSIFARYSFILQKS